MKRKFLLISMCAAVMFFSSCSKEDNTVDTKEVNNQTEVNATKAITVSAKQKSSVSKVALGIENQGKYEEVFSEGEVLTLYLNNEVITTLVLTDGAGKTTATFSGEIPLSADGQTISAKILPSATPSGLTECSSFAAAVSTYASLYGTFTYNASADNFSLTLDDEVSYFVVETNMSAVDINTDTYGSSVFFAFNEDQTVSSAALKLNNVELTAGGAVYFKTLNLVTGITLNKTSTTIAVGGTETLTATISPANATDKTYTWSSSDENVATVDANGEVTAVAAGTTTIKATANDGSEVYGECDVLVESEATPIRSLDEIQGSGKYILVQDIEVDDFYIEQNSNIDIDLNGHTITTESAIDVDNATLTLRGSGTIYCAIETRILDPENPSFTDERRHDGFSLYNNAVLNLYGNVTIKNAQSGVFVFDTSNKINMYGGTITDCVYGVYAYGKGQDVLNNQGGTISGNDTNIY